MNKSVKYRKEFIAFLKANKAYSAYMRAFKAENLKTVSDRYNKERPDDFGTFLKINTPNLWIIKAFTWFHIPTIDWHEIHKQWINKLNKFKKNENI